MRVSPAIRMFSAISLGVFCRCAPSTSAIMRSRNVSPGLEVMRILMWSESTLVPPGNGAAVATRFANHWSALAGDHRFIHRRDAFDDFAVAGNQIARLAEDDITRAQRGSGNLFGAVRRSIAWRAHPSWSSAACRPALFRELPPWLRRSWRTAR